ncbi:unnamed protein product [Rotaria sp. Silwood2]|nr:unnamed protein product [Rotaria sp. Silwood2]CAF2736851.1 unnamed protein product [Rotaria sp. Silwood2]CAF3003597.1 unnamed protein product [Rotaria sp. Silwood2]CAF3129662.1 unnamed protein product [Rotaria sp. Silwood2]CAF4017608.1 unnamed protein product [Rotaria sp. Silwood2]
METLRATKDAEEDTETEDNRFENAHGTVMILAWMVFASTAILFARYGRTIRFGSKDKLLGESNWFQIHRLLACLTTVVTLLGFFLILVQAQGGWVGNNEGLVFAHSVPGGIIVCCALVQAWMALFRCHPNGTFRYIFNWLHRLTGVLAFFLSIPTIFLIAAQMDESRTGMIIILSIWSGWVVLIVIVLEIIQFVRRKSSSTTINTRSSTEQSGFDIKKINDSIIARWNNGILILFLLHIIVSVALAIPFIVLIWN